MDGDNYSDLEIREVFHLEFLRYLGRRVRPESYALKGGVNLRLFFNSIRYSEDMDLDAVGIRVYSLKEHVMDILRSPAFQGNLKSFGIKEIVPPAIERAKQTETTQRFKIHLITSANMDLFTKIEFSRRGMSGQAIVEAPLEPVLRRYKINPVLVPHYDINSAVTQKIKALSDRTVVQARDIFDLYLLSPRYLTGKTKKHMWMEKGVFRKAYENIFEVSFEVFRGAVIVYLSAEDQPVYDNHSAWEEIRLRVAGFINQLEKEYE